MFVLQREVHHITPNTPSHPFKRATLSILEYLDIARELIVKKGATLSNGLNTFRALVLSSHFHHNYASSLIRLAHMFSHTKEEKISIPNLLLSFHFLSHDILSSSSTAVRNGFSQNEGLSDQTLQLTSKWLHEVIIEVKREKNTELSVFSVFKKLIDACLA